MGYEISLDLAWKRIERFSPNLEQVVSLFSTDYKVAAITRTIIKQPNGELADEFQMVLILHYLIGFIEHGYRPTNELISFKETEGGMLFWPAFRETAIKPLVEFFEYDEGLIIGCLRNLLNGTPIEGGDIAIQIPALPEISIRIIFWRKDNELPADATILFDKGLCGIYSTEDIAVLLMLPVRILKEIPLS